MHHSSSKKEFYINNIIKFCYYAYLQTLLNLLWNVCTADIVLVSQLERLIYVQKLKQMCNYVVSACPICLLAAPRRLKRIWETLKTEVFQPGQCLISDSMYMPTDRYGYSKAVLIKTVHLPM